MESKFFYEMKRAQPKPAAAKHYVKCGGFRYNTKTGAVFGDAYKLMTLVSVGDEFLADTVVNKQGENSALAKRAVNLFGSLPSI